MSDLAPPSAALQVATLHETDLRQHRRHLCVDGGVLRLSVRPEFRGRALLFDVSAGGIGFLLEDPLESGTVLVFELKDPGGTDSMNRLVRVRHCRAHAVPPDAPWLPRPSRLSRIFRAVLGMQAPPLPQAWLVGCQFDRPLTEDEIKQLLVQLQPLSDL